MPYSRSWKPPSTFLTVEGLDEDLQPTTVTFFCVWRNDDTADGLVPYVFATDWSSHCQGHEDGDPDEWNNDVFDVRKLAAWKGEPDGRYGLVSPYLDGSPVRCDDYESEVYAAMREAVKTGEIT